MHAPQHPPPASLASQAAPGGCRVPGRQFALLAGVRLPLLGRLPQQRTDDSAGPGPVGIWVVPPAALSRAAIPDGTTGE
jgi:hypothetical protein